MHDLTVTRIRFVAAEPEDQVQGLLGYLGFDLGGSLRLESVALRRTLRGDLALAFPKRTDGTGTLRHFIRPLRDEVRRDIEHQVFRALGMDTAIPAHAGHEEGDP